MTAESTRGRLMDPDRMRRYNDAKEPPTAYALGAGAPLAALAAAMRSDANRASEQVRRSALAMQRALESAAAARRRGAER